MTFTLAWSTDTEGAGTMGSYHKKRLKIESICDDSSEEGGRKTD